MINGPLVSQAEFLSQHAQRKSGYDGMEACTYALGYMVSFLDGLAKENPAVRRALEKRILETVIGE